MEELKEYEMIFDDREFDDFETTKEGIVEVDEKFNEQVSKEIDEFFKKNPLQYED